MRSLFPILFLFMLFMPTLLYAEGGLNASLKTGAKQAYLMDYETGAVLLSKNAKERMPTSSMSKVLTTLVVFDALKAGHIKLDDTFLVSEKAWKKGGSKMFVEVNKQVKLEDLLRGVIVQSGNDATIVLAEGLTGSEDAFAVVLNKKAQALGMEESHFTNASGWPDPDHYSTAQDLALLAQALIREHPDYYTYYAEKEFTFNDITQANRNPLLYRDIGADGIKTGHTEAGGYGLIGSGVRDGRRVILVVNGLESAKDRAQESARLLAWGLQSFQNKVVFKAGDVVEQASVSMGQDVNVPLVLDAPLTLTLPKISGDGWTTKIHLNGPLIAPLQKGQELGILEIDVGGLYSIKRPVLAGANIKELGFFSKMFVNIRDLILGPK